MEHIGIDVHKRDSQICIVAEGGELWEQRIRTEPERFAAVLGTRPRARILIEASVLGAGISHSPAARGGISRWVLVTLSRRSWDENRTAKGAGMTGSDAPGPLYEVFISYRAGDQALAGNWSVVNISTWARGGRVPGGSPAPLT